MGMQLRIVAVGMALGLLGAASACATDTSGNGSGGLPSSSAATTPTPTPTPTASKSLPESTSVPPTSSTPVSTTPASTPPPAKPLRTLTVTTTISGEKYVIKVWAEKKDPTCADHAYGTPVVNYLQAHPCAGLHRLLGTTVVKGKAVGFAESRLGFVGAGDAVYKVAGDFVDLVTKEGTGNVDDLLRDGYRLPSGPTSVPSPDAFNAQGQDAGVIIDDIWYLDGPTPDNDPPLVQFARDIFLQFG